MTITPRKYFIKVLLLVNTLGLFAQINYAMESKEHIGRHNGLNYFKREICDEISSLSSLESAIKTQATLPQINMPKKQHEWLKEESKEHIGRHNGLNYFKREICDEISSLSSLESAIKTQAALPQINMPKKQHEWLKEESMHDLSLMRDHTQKINAKRAREEVEGDSVLINSPTASSGVFREQPNSCTGLRQFYAASGGELDPKRLKSQQSYPTEGSSELRNRIHAEVQRVLKEFQDNMNAYYERTGNPKRIAMALDNKISLEIPSAHGNAFDSASPRGLNEISTGVSTSTTTPSTVATKVEGDSAKGFGKGKATKK